MTMMPNLHSLLLHILVLSIYIPSSSSSSTIVNDDELLNVISRVPRVNWSFGDDVGMAMDASRGSPVVFENAPSNAWNAMNWTLSRMRRRFTRDLRLPVKILRNQEDKFHLGCCVPERLKARTFAKRLGDYANQGKVGYFAGPLQFLGKSLQDDVDVSMYDAREVSPQSEYCQYVAETQCLQTTVWIGSRFATTPCHHDELHNFFVQIQGRKRFTLFPPDAWSELQLYPKYHQYHRNVRADIESNTSKRPGRVDVELNPGDVLYLPPLWFHQVQALTNTSISVNVWSASRWIRDVMTIWNEDVPSDLKTNDDDVTNLIRRLASYVKTIVIAVLGNSGFLETVWRTRYDTTSSREMNEKSAEYVQHQEYIKRVDKDSPSFLTQHGISNPESALDVACSSMIRPVSRYETNANRIAAIFREATRQSEDRGRVRWVRGGATEIYLAHYLEDLISQVVGFQYVNYFFRQCLLVDVVVENSKSEL